MKPQIIYIPWGVAKENFTDYDAFLRQLEYQPWEEIFLSWNKTIWENLWDWYQYIRAPFREKEFADYEAWKIMFEKLSPFLKENVILIAGSLWGTFLLKYLTENAFPVRIGKIFFVAPALNDTKQEQLGTFQFDKKKISQISRLTKEIFIYHSRDDTIVPISDSLELLCYLPQATFKEFSDRGHFYLQTRFPEIEEEIKKTENWELRTEK